MHRPVGRLPRWDDVGWWARYWDDVVPRFVVLRLHVDRFRFGWFVPLWAIEETLRCLILLLPWGLYVTRRIVPAWGTTTLRPKPGFTISIDGPARAPWRALAALLDGHGEGLLRLRRGESLVLVEAVDAGRRVTVEIKQV
jgi:hypothetical protein